MNVRDIFGNGKDRPPAPEVASAEDIEQYQMKWLQHNPQPAVDDARPSDPTVEMPFTAKGLDDRLNQKSEFPWLYDPDKGIRWDFDPIKLRNLAQENTWVGMMVQTITKEIAETPFSIVKQDDRNELRKRLSEHPETRTPVAKAADAEEFPDATAERIDDLLRNPNPDHGWHDLVEMWMGDLLEVGSATTVKVFPKSVYDGEGNDATLAVDPEATRPRALQVSAPEVWTKGYDGRTGIQNAYWQFDDERSPGTGSSEGGTTGSFGFRSPIEFAPAEIMWTDMTPRSNRRYGMPPTLLVEDFLQSLDLAVKQEQQYLSRGSIPSGAWVFEQWDREEVKEWKQENAENIKGKPHKSLMFAGRGGDVRFEAMSMNFSELEFTERMKYYARVVASVFQVPTAVVGIEPEKVNYNTFQGERENFEENTLGPYMQKLERFINDELIRPHWGRQYHFEFKPGMSETTRSKISGRVRKEFQSGLIRRNEARQALGRDDVDEEFDGFQDEVVEDTAPDDEGDLGGLMSSTDAVAKAEYEVGDETIDLSPPDYMIAAAEAGQQARDEFDGLDDCGTGVGNERARQIIGDEVGPDTVAEIASYLTSHEEDVASLDGNYTDWTEAEWTDGCGTVQYALWGGTGDGRSLDWAQEKANAVADARGETLPYEASTGAGRDGGSGNANAAVSKDEPLRNDDEWYQFDVQPEMVEELQADIADDIRDLFDAVLADDRIAEIIDRLAADADDETAKSTISLARRVRELLEQQRLSGDIADAIRANSAEAIRSTLQDTVEDADAADVDVDVERVTSRLEERDVAFADRFANELSETIRDTVGDGWADGKNSRAIAEDIAEQANISEGWGGAERIARQELQVATGEARSAVAEDLGKVEVWNDSGDNRVRDTHADMDGLWKYADEDWVVDYSAEDRGIKKESVPGDSEPGIGCRCTTLLRDEDEVDDGDYAGDGSSN